MILPTVTQGTRHSAGPPECRALARSRSSALTSANGRFGPDPTLTATIVYDWVSLPAAGRSWDKAAIPKLLPERQVLPQANIQRVSERLPTAAATGPKADWQVLGN